MCCVFLLWPLPGRARFFIQIALSTPSYRGSVNQITRDRQEKQNDQESRAEQSQRPSPINGMDTVHWGIYVGYMYLTELHRKTLTPLLTLPPKTPHARVYRITPSLNSRAVILHIERKRGKGIFYPYTSTPRPTHRRTSYSYNMVPQKEKTQSSKL